MTRDLFAPKFSLSYLLGTRPALAAEHAADRLLAAAGPVVARPSGGVLTRGMGRSAALALIALAVLAGPGLSLLRSGDPTIETAAAASAAPRATSPRTTDAHASRSAARAPFQVQTAVVQVATFRQAGVATWYGPGFHGRRTANGEIFNSGAMTAAHRTLPFGTKLRVCTTKRCVFVRVNDRGPFGPGRILDLSRAAAAALGTQRSGVARVKIDVVTEETVLTSPAPPLGPLAPDGQLDLLPAASTRTASTTWAIAVVALLALFGGGAVVARRTVPAFAS